MNPLYVSLVCICLICVRLICVRFCVRFQLKRLCLICIPYMYALYVYTRVFGSNQRSFALYVSLMCTPHMCTRVYQVPIKAVLPHMCPLCVRLICMPHMCPICVHACIRFQSKQFRLIENKLGLDADQRILHSGCPYFKHIPDTKVSTRTHSMAREHILWQENTFYCIAHLALWLSVLYAYS